MLNQSCKENKREKVQLSEQKQQMTTYHTEINAMHDMTSLSGYFRYKYTTNATKKSD